MEINITLLIQGCNFFLAYLMVRILLLTPVCKIITNNKKHHDLVCNTIAQLEESINKAKRTQQGIWKQMRTYFIEKSPSLADQDLYVFKGITPEVEIETADKQEKQALIKSATTVITNKIMEQ